MSRGTSAFISAATSCSGWSTKRSTPRVSTSLSPGTLRTPFRKVTFGSNQRCVYKCPSNSHRHGGPPPPLGVHGANTGFSFSEYIRHEMYWTAEIARPTVFTDHHAVHRRSTSGNRTPRVVSAPTQRYGRGF